MPACNIRPLNATEATLFQQLRLEALQDAPTAFGSSFEEESALGLEHFRAWITAGDGSVILGAFAGTTLVGIVGINRQRRLKIRHKATIWTVYITPSQRGTGLGRQLMRAAIDHARAIPGLAQLQLTVSAGNAAACTLYSALGFVEYGQEPQALCVAGVFHDEKLMAMPVALAASALEYKPVSEADFEALLDLRIEAMRESLERLGRFDPARARERLQATFAPEHTWSIERNGQRIGFYALRPAQGALRLDHLYMRPDEQGQGNGAAVMQRVFRQADASGMAVYLGALRESDSNRFYRKHGFVQIGEGQWDIEYVREAQAQ